MNRILIACDLDNTIIHSFKYRKDSDICIEWIHGKPQGFISVEAIRLLKELASVALFVPVTTRSIEQYKRIIWPDESKPQWAITSNGGVMLHNNNRSPEWDKTVSQYVIPYYDEIKRMHRILSPKNEFIRCRLVDNIYVFVYCNKDINAKVCSQEYEKQTNLNVIASGKKIYFFPPQINKGMATSLIKRSIEADIIISAGDSMIDIPMLDKADYAIVPNEYLSAQVHSNKVFTCGKENDFSEYVLKTALEIINRFQ